MDTVRGLESMTRKKNLRILDELKVEEPCHEAWGAMTGDTARRYCERCSKCVTNLSVMTKRKAERHLSRNISTGICVRYILDEHGNILFKPPRRFHSLVHAAVLCLASFLSLLGIANNLSAEYTDPPKPLAEDAHRVTMGKIAAPTATPGYHGPEVVGLVAIPRRTPTPVPAGRKE